MFRRKLQLNTENSEVSNDSNIQSANFHAKRQHWTEPSFILRLGYGTHSLTPWWEKLRVTVFNLLNSRLTNI